MLLWLRKKIRKRWHKLRLIWFVASFERIWKIKAEIAYKNQSTKATAHIVLLLYLQTLGILLKILYPDYKNNSRRRNTMDEKNWTICIIKSLVLRLIPLLFLSKIDRIQFIKKNLKLYKFSAWSLITFQHFMDNWWRGKKNGLCEILCTCRSFFAEVK